MPPVIDHEKCRSCGTCDRHCPGDVIFQEGKKKPVVLYPLECWHCGCCRQDCPEGAVTISFPPQMLNI
jgi:adenylylsulfate reductase subunit B